MQTIIFDMDGVLVDSEPLWQEAMILKINEFLQKSGISYIYTKKDCVATRGMRIFEVIQKIFLDFDLTYKEDVCLKLVDDIVLELKVLLKKRGKPMKGLIDLLKKLKKHNFKIGLASSSSRDLIDTVLSILAIKEYFQVIYSGDDVEKSKPYPEIFNKTMLSLESSPSDTLIIEDSCNGVLAAVRSKAQVIAVPEKNEIEKIVNHPELQQVVLVENLEEVSHKIGL